ncbi:AraC family transcriptional regulator [Winogradskyella flava]|uniref:Helix-turn-helix transcriptional regulator n=1 Tax=Winogradskyella flava TaxID=1884876 RepID=A0A842ITI1_9FLAO|nr:AraC family transcriptional regulator [Winogradskyella flava]MBC2845096.1 helix-turn-helix transcriptional regulator [Winogradskyella flava]
MLTLHKGAYTGKIVRHFNVDKNLITNTINTYEQSTPYWHCHEKLNISFVFQGGKAETKKKQSYAKNGGSIFFYHSGELHRWIAPNPISKSINVEIEADFLKKYHLNEDDIKQSIHNNIDSKALLLKMQKEMQINDETSATAIQTLLFELVSFSNTKSDKREPRWVNLLRELLNDNWNKQLRLNDMAKIVGVHPVTISKYFRRYFSCTLGAYQRKLKTNRSIDLIKNSQLSLSEIAYACGFADQSHFIRSFKQQTNFLPKDFRRF